MQVFQFDQAEHDQKSAEQKAIDQFRDETGKLGKVTETLSFGRYYTVAVIPFDPRSGR